MIGNTLELTGSVSIGNTATLTGNVQNAIAKVNGDYNPLINHPKINGHELIGNKTGQELGLASSSDIPTKVSDLQNDGDGTNPFITKTVDDLTNYYTKSQTYNKDEVYNKTEVYNKNEVYDKDEVYSKNETYPKTDVYNKNETYPKSDVYNKTETYGKSEVYNKTEADSLLGNKQDELVSGTNIKTINNASLLGEGNVAVQEPLVSGSNIKTINGNSIVGSGNVTIGDMAKVTSPTENDILVTNSSGQAVDSGVQISDIPHSDEVSEKFFIKQSTRTSTGLIQKLKGSTIVWNQLISEQFSHTFTAGGSNQNVNIERINNIVVGHKYLYAITQANSMTSNVRNTLQYLYSNGTNVTVNESNDINHNLNSGRYGWIFTAPSDNANNWISLYYWCHTPNVDVTIKDAILVDLTQMFGAGNEPTSVSDFTDLFPLPYYDYNAGSLLSFNGTGIKSTGKNLLSYSGENLPYNANGVSITRENNIYKVVATNPSGYPFTRINTIHYLQKGQYTITMLGAETSNTGIGWRLIDRNVSPVKLIVNASTTTTTFTLNEDVHDIYFEITIDASRLTTNTWDVRFTLEKGRQTDYEPYTETTTPLPTSTYFPTGMKSAGSVYDELTPNKAIVRAGSVDMGTLTWYAQSTYGFYTTGLSSVIKSPVDNYTKANIICAIRETSTWADLATSGTGTNYIAVSSGYLGIADNSGMTAVQFKESLSGVYLYYELATPTETLIDEDMVINVFNGGTEELQPVNTSSPSTTQIDMIVDYAVNKVVTTSDLVNDGDGNSKFVTFDDIKDGIVMKSPNNTLYKVTVANDGTLSVTAL